MIIAIDFDGTVTTKDSEARNVFEFRSNALKVIKQLKLDGHELILHTCRTKKSFKEAIQVLNENNVYFDKYNENLDYINKKWGSDSRKVYADLYIDDRGIGGLPSWNEIYKLINK